MSSLHGKLEEYLAVRRAMGFKMERHEKLLGQFAGFLAENGETAVTIENALAWATLPAAARPRWHALRLSAVRGFAAWLNAADPAHQVPPRRLIPYGSRAVVPYLYSDEEIAALAREAGRLSGRLRAATFQTLIRLLAVTGMRVGEAIRLDRSDYDAAAGDPDRPRHQVRQVQAPSAAPDRRHRPEQVPAALRRAHARPAGTRPAADRPRMPAALRADLGDIP